MRKRSLLSRCPTYIGFHVKCSLFLSDFDETLNFLDRFSKITPIRNFMKILPEGADIFHTDGWTDRRAEKHTDMTKITDDFLNFTMAPNNTGTSARFQHAILTIKWLQTYVLDRKATLIGTSLNISRVICHHHCTHASYPFTRHRRYIMLVTESAFKYTPHKAVCTRLSR